MTQNPQSKNLPNGRFSTFLKGMQKSCEFYFYKRKRSKTWAFAEFWEKRIKEGIRRIVNGL